MIEEKMMKAFWHLHEHPEISYEETETTEYIYNLLEAEGFTPVRFKNTTGLYCDMGNFDKGPVIGVRADIDALYQEVDGVKQANHSCGHDAHMAMVIATMLKIKDDPVLDSKGVRFIFQPAEEVGTGALAVVDEGVVDDLDYFSAFICGRWRKRVTVMQRAASNMVQHLPSSFASRATMHTVRAPTSTIMP
ncbi:M20/M25/M40 family metallo-hydrolase [Salinicoccus sp. CNSTN-B1]